jgi:hypothetical protein
MAKSTKRADRIGRLPIPDRAKRPADINQNSKRNKLKMQNYRGTGRPNKGKDSYHISLVRCSGVSKLPRDSRARRLRPISDGSRFSRRVCEYPVVWGGDPKGDNPMGEN